LIAPRVCQVIESLLLRRAQRCNSPIGPLSKQRRSHGVARCSVLCCVSSQSAGGFGCGLLLQHLETSLCPPRNPPCAAPCHVWSSRRPCAPHTNPQTHVLQSSTCVRRLSERKPNSHKRTSWFALRGAMARPHKACEKRHTEVY
jgi:hypothetical protein